MRLPRLSFLAAHWSEVRPTRRSALHRAGVYLLAACIPAVVTVLPVMMAAEVPLGARLLAAVLLTIPLVPLLRCHLTEPLLDGHVHAWRRLVARAAGRQDLVVRAEHHLVLGRSYGLGTAGGQEIFTCRSVLQFCVTCEGILLGMHDLRPPGDRGNRRVADEAEATAAVRGALAHGAARMPA